MSVTQNPPGTIYLGGPRTEIGDLAASEAITPGHLIERFNSAGVWRVRKHATAGGDTPRMFATEQSMLNQGVGDAYAANDLVEATVGSRGTSVWAWIASGQNIVFGNKLESAGDGTLRIFASGAVLAQALETQANVTVATRIRVEVV